MVDSDGAEQQPPEHEVVVKRVPPRSGSDVDVNGCHHSAPSNSAANISRVAPSALSSDVVVGARPTSTSRALRRSAGSFLAVTSFITLRNPGWPSHSPAAAGAGGAGGAGTAGAGGGGTRASAAVATCWSNTSSAVGSPRKA